MTAVVIAVILRHVLLSDHRVWQQLRRSLHDVSISPMLADLQLARRTARDQTRPPRRIARQYVRLPGKHAPFHFNRIQPLLLQARNDYGTVGQYALGPRQARSEEHTSELQSLMRTSYSVFCL